MHNHSLQGRAMPVTFQVEFVCLAIVMTTVLSTLLPPTIVVGLV